MIQKIVSTLVSIKTDNINIKLVLKVYDSTQYITYMYVVNNVTNL